MPKAPQTKFTPQNILNNSYNTDFDLLEMLPTGFDGVNAQMLNADNLAVKVTEDGDDTYIAIAAPGSSQAEAVWQAKKINNASGTLITWADGDANFDNVATDLTALSYT